MAKPTPLKNTRRLWAAISMSDLVADEGGWITSVPNNAEIRMECRVDSDLPETLADLGYELQSLGSTERLLPVGGGVAPVTVEIWSFQMPQLVTEKRHKTIVFPSS
jgi:hypothetical protein